MADILIRGVQFPTMPQAYKALIVSYDGKVYEGVYPQPITKKKEPISHAVELPEHGDLISREEALSMPFANRKYDHENANEHFIFGCETYKEWLEQLPVVISSNKEDTK